MRDLVASIHQERQLSTQSLIVPLKKLLELVS
jgi:hypothetical protein